MGYSWLLTAWRNFIKHRAFSIINVGGLSLGIASFIAIILYVIDEFSYDAFHERAGQIYRLNAITSYDGAITRYSTTSTPLADAIRQDIQQVQAVSRLFWRQATMQVYSADSTIQNEKFRENNFFFADPDILKVLSFKFISGSRTEALSNPNKVIVTRKIAEKYFTSASLALGEQLLYEASIPLEVAAVIEDLPAQSSYPIEILAPFENYYTLEAPEVQDFLKRDWLYNPVTTFVLLTPDANPEHVSTDVKKLNAKYADERVRDHVEYELQNLKEIHLRSDFTYETNRNTFRYSIIFLGVGILILAIAVINFVNLATAQSLRRAREIGIRKVNGAARIALIIQFLTESLLMVLCASILAMALVYYALPLINSTTGKSISVASLFSFRVMVMVAVTFVATGLAAGLHPALYISGFNPIAALKGQGRNPGKGLLIRRILVVAQFTASIVLIVLTLIIYNQVTFMQTKDLGFQKDRMLTIPLFSSNPNSILGGGIGRELRMRMNSFENEVLNYPGVEAISVSSDLPGAGAVNALITTDEIRESDNVFIPVVSVDYDFIETYKMKILEGRGFSKDAGTDHLQAFVANEEAIRLLGWNNPSEAIGHHVKALGKEAIIVGVVQNYHFEGLQQVLRPLLLEVDVSKFTAFSLRLSAGAVADHLATVRKKWDDVFPEKVFDYQFLDDRLNLNYEQESRFGKLITFFSLMAVFISALGLFGLAAFVAFQKRREAGIRKILGASTFQVFNTLSKEFLRIVVLSAVLSVPIGYYFANVWLSDFHYRIPVSWIPFLIAFSATFLVVFVTTVYQTFRTSSINPVITIRNE